MQVEIKELLEAGAHFGHKSEKWNPKMSSFIYTKKGGIHIIDLTKTKEKLAEALEFIKKSASEGKTVLFVGTKKQAQQVVKIEAEKASSPYVNIRWLGGTLTNFQTIIKQVKKLNSLRDEKEKGEWEKYSKKEKSVRQKQLENLEKSIGGLENLRAVPDILYIIDTGKEHLAVKEAKKIGIPVVGIVDSNGDPTIIDYPIPANDDALKVIKLITEKVTGVILEAKPVLVKEEEEEKEPPMSAEGGVGVPTKSVGKKEIEEKEEEETKDEEARETEKEIKDESIEEIEEKLKEEIEEEEIEAKKTAAAKVLTEKKVVKK